MPSHNSQLAQVGKRQLELSNLAKVLYPEDHITKAHLIEYYLKVAPTVLAHLKGRPLSLLRFPEGIRAKPFFQKNRPDWAPEWLEHVILGEEKKDYVIATEPASLVWLANLACIELHQMHSRAPDFDKPDYIVYDLDPPENYSFQEVAQLAFEFRRHLESFGYQAFVKTTGRKGLHILTPIEANWDFSTVFEAAKALAQPFVDSHRSVVTLQLKKDYRKDRVLLDIYRNRPSQTIVAAYSLRGLPGAPVSTPVHWEELETLASPQAFNLHSVPARLAAGADPWEAISAFATAIHTQREATASRTLESKRSWRTATSKSNEVMRKPLAPSRTHKTPEQLQAYSSKRSFGKTPEPPPTRLAEGGSAFVVHRHHASRLHYDLRLEQAGVLRSWAVPKGLPPRPGILRLAVSVEDHPLDYVHFEGAIPKGEYGAGMMWKFAQGRHEITRQKKDGFYFRLHSPELNGEYRLHHTKDTQWLLERVDTPQLDWPHSSIAPMLARAADTPPNSTDYHYEVKWDGIRALIFLDEGDTRIRGRNGMDLTKNFPELLMPEQSFRATSAVFDGEIVCLDAEGKPLFADVISRMQQTSTAAIERARAKHPAVCYLFDCLYLDGRPVVDEPLARRREWLADAVKEGTAYRLSGAFDDGISLFEAVRKMGLEGIMAKRTNCPYLPGKRSETWLKIKARRTLECVIIGYTQGKGDRQAAFGALHLAQPSPGGFKYVGKVGTGFNDRTLKALAASIEHLTKTGNPFKNNTFPGARSVWVEPKLMCEVQYASITSDGILREPVFLRLRPDLTVQNAP